MDRERNVGNESGEMCDVAKANGGGCEVFSVLVVWVGWGVGGVGGGGWGGGGGGGGWVRVNCTYSSLNILVDRHMHAMRNAIRLKLINFVSPSMYTLRWKRSKME